jgi:hypothetical protein
MKIRFSSSVRWCLHQLSSPTKWVSLEMKVPSVKVLSTVAFALVLSSMVRLCSSSFRSSWSACHSTRAVPEGPAQRVTDRGTWGLDELAKLSRYYHKLAVL